MSAQVLDVVVIGGGQAGLGIAHFLKSQGRDFQVLEQGRVGESWRSQRWDSFTLNTPNATNGLPGMPYDGPEPDGFWTASELVEYFERYKAKFNLPVREGVTVTAVSQSPSNGTFTVRLDDPAQGAEEMATREVVVAAGIQRVPTIPDVGSQFPESINQIHASQYRSVDELPAGAVVVVGSGQSGCQIAEDLAESDRTVYLCTSGVGRVPRRYRGRDGLQWWAAAGMWDTQAHELDDPNAQFSAQPQISGVGRYGRTVSLQHMAGQGIRLMGRLTEISDGVLGTDDSLGVNIAKADERSAVVKEMIDAFIEARGIDAPPAEPDERDAPAASGLAESGLTELDLTAAGVGTVIWCTGFTGDFGWIDAPAFKSDGTPIHDRGVSAVPGLYFLGFPWLYKRKSGIILGIDEDAAHLASVIADRLD
jgi:putative flavoprotein involved in K+ transport